jgi:hypothetical protein
MHPEQARLRALADSEDMVLVAGGAEMDAVALRRDLFERPDLGVEIGRLMEIANAELDAADAGDLHVHGVTSRGSAGICTEARGQRTIRAG